MEQSEGKDRLRELARRVQADLGAKGPARSDSVDGAEIKRMIRESVNGIVRYYDDVTDEEVAELVKMVEDESFGYGALQRYLDDDWITEIMVNGHDFVAVERDGVLEEVGEKVFESDDEVKRLIDKIAAEQNKHCDIHTPDMDARLSDGSRVNAVIPPIAKCGPCITIRKFPKHRLDATDLVNMGSASMEMMNMLICFVQARCNMLVSGGTGSGKTTLLNILSSFIPPSERVITIEDTAELQLNSRNWVPLEARSANADDEGEISIHRLLVDSLRMRPDRIIVGECRSTETIEMLQAMNTGHDGSLTTIHANDPRSAFLRIVTMVQATQNLTIENINMQIASAMQVIVQTSRFRDGSRKISEIMALTGRVEGRAIETTPLMRFVEDGVGKDGMIYGRYVPTGNPLPQSIIDRLDVSGVPFDSAWLMQDGAGLY